MLFSEAVVAFLPLAVLAGFSLVVLLLGPIRRVSPLVAMAIAVIACAAGGLGALYNVDWQGTAFGGTLAFGGITGVMTALFCFGGLLVILFSHGYMLREGGHLPEFYTLVLFALLGMSLMAAARDFIVLFVGLELMSLCFYVLAGLFRTRASSNESALKYFLLGAFATGFFLYGVALIFGVTGSTGYDAIHAVSASTRQQPLFLLGCALILVTFLFKLAAVPFHMWAPDVYEGAPTAVTAFMSSLGKAAALTALATLSAYLFDGIAMSIRPVLAVVAVLTMAVGNIAALRQTNVKRMLAYSSIAHAGYALVGLSALSQGGRGAVFFYAIVYTFMQAGAFGIVAELERGGERTTLKDYQGLSTRRPILAFALSIFLFSLAGIPPFGGFFGKYYLFAAAVGSGQTWLAIVAVIASMISVYFYIGLVLRMYFQDAESTELVTVTPFGRAGLVLASAVIVLMGILPGSIVELVGKFLS